jgi:hypothetical protein
LIHISAIQHRTIAHSTWSNLFQLNKCSIDFYSSYCLIGFTHRLLIPYTHIVWWWRRWCCGREEVEDWSSK